jgi:predicted nucleotidyltransferase
MVEFNDWHTKCLHALNKIDRLQHALKTIVDLDKRDGFQIISLRNAQQIAKEALDHELKITARLR